MLRFQNSTPVDLVSMSRWFVMGTISSRRMLWFDGMGDATPMMPNYANDTSGFSVIERIDPNNGTEWRFLIRGTRVSNVSTSLRSSEWIDSRWRDLL